MLGAPLTMLRVIGRALINEQSRELLSLASAVPVVQLRATVAIFSFAGASSTSIELRLRCRQWHAGGRWP